MRERKTKITFHVTNKKQARKLNNLTFLAVYIENHAKETHICNAISAIAWTLAGVLCNLRDNTTYEVNPNTGFMHIRIDKPSKMTNNAFDFFFIGMQQVKKKYPDSVEIEFRQVSKAP